MKRLAIIPARGGSKRIPHKNIKDFCGKPMMMHSAHAAQNSEIFSKIHISTDDKNIEEIAKSHGFAPDFLRPDSLSNDHASMLEAVKFVVKEYEQQDMFFDTVALIYATSPLVCSKDLKSACKEFEASDKQKAYLAVTVFPSPIEHAFRITEDKELYPDNAEALYTRTQDLQHAYYDAGMFAFYTPQYIKNSEGGGDFSQFKGYKVPSFRVTDIDWPEDWERAEALFKALNH